VAATTAVVAGTASAVSGSVSHRQQERYASQAQEEAAQQYAAQQYATQQYAAQQPPAPDYAAELEKLARLKQQGLISEEDFEAKKKQILGI
jgi:hypothetical protein